MRKPNKPLTILTADDDLDDCLLMKEAFAETPFGGDPHFVGDGEALMEYLLHCCEHSEASPSPHPCLILLDLNMPTKHGREALKEIMSHLHLRSIPVVVLTTSKTKADIIPTYESGASSISKPDTFEGQVAFIRTPGRYWSEVATLPPDCGMN